MAAEKWIVCFFLTALACSFHVDAWSGHYYHVRNNVRYTSYRTCRVWFLWCWSYKTVHVTHYTPVYGCCPGWTHRSGSQNCDIATCNPPCRNGGSCVSASSPNCRSWTGHCSCNPNKCNCPFGRTGISCEGTTCSHLAPCYPGECIGTDGCQCTTGFRSTAGKANYCNTIDYGVNPNVDLKIYTMQVRLSYWTRGTNPSTERYRLLTDSTRLEENQMDFLWTNMKDFNRLETTCSSQFFTEDLPAKPAYIKNTVLGIISAEAVVELSKRPIYPQTERFYSLNGTVQCPIPVSVMNPEPGLYECNISNPNFDRFLEHGDFLKVTYITKGGGFREIIDLNTNRFYVNRTFLGPEKNMSVEFRFDFQAPYHCDEKGACRGGENMLEVPEITKTSPLRIFWTGWEDDDSGVYRYAMEVFKMTRTADGGLEIKPSEALNPLINKEVMHASMAAQNYEPPGPGMYSIILEVADQANNTKYARRFCLYDPTSDVTSDPNNPFYVTTASQAANFSYQNDLNAVVVTWDQHFRNAFHEENQLLGYVRRYPPSLDGKKVIPRDTNLDDHEGKITVDGVTNKRGIVKFYVHHATDHTGGLQQPDVPRAWQDLFLNTTWTVPDTAGEGDTVTIWVKAVDIMNNERVEKTKVTFDSTPPEVQYLAFHMNRQVPGIPFSSVFELVVNDDASGVAYITWTFARENGTVLYQETVPGKRVPSEECTDFRTCECTPAKDCFLFDQSFAVSNCHMMVEKENLGTENITVTAEVTNMAGLVTTRSMQKGNLTMLNGTDAYYPPQNVKAVKITPTGVTLTWDFLTTCYPPEKIWVIVNGEAFPVDGDAKRFDLSGLDSDKDYTIFVKAAYQGGQFSEQMPLTFTTAKDVISAGTIAGLTIGVLLLLTMIAFIAIFVLWRRGVILQRDTTVTRQLKKVDGAFQSVRRMTMRGRPERPNTHFNKSYLVEEDEIYQYGEMTFETRPSWQLNASSLTLLDQVAEGKFANIYKATWSHSGRKDLVAVKMPKPGFSEEDALKMMAKINFFATQFDDHEHVLRFLGAVTDYPSWGPVMVMEYCDNGQMDKWLAARRDHVTEQVMEELFHFSLGVAKGMEYLASKGFAHRRLAARNVLLSNDLEVRVAGFGPQHKEGGEDVHTRVPAKWAAPEVLKNDPPTEKSDVWSYGVVLWEIFSLGQLPYPNFHSNEIGARLKGGYRMPKPELADTLHYDLMKECWQYKPAKRPTFKTIRARLEQQYNPGNRQSVDFYYDTGKLGEHD